MVNTDLAIVDADDASDHLRDDDHITEVGFYDCGFFIGGSFFFCFTEFLDEAHGTTFEAASEPPASTSVYELRRS